MSPLPNIGILIRGLSFTLPIRVQSASPLYIWALVLPWILSALIPISCSLSLTSKIFKLFSSQPKRVLIVTGNEVAFTTAAVNLTIKSTSFKIPAPAPLQTTFLTGQPKFISNKSGFVASTILAEISKASSSPPKIWMPIGCS